MPVGVSGQERGIPARSSLAGDSPGAVRNSYYVDSTGTHTGEWRKSERIYNATAAAVVRGQVCLITEDGDEETEPKAIVIAAGTVPKRICVAAEAIAVDSWGEFFTAGWCDALCHGTTDIAKDNTLITTAAVSTTAFIGEGVSVRTAKSFAVAAEAFSTNGEVALKKVKLFGDPADPD